MTEFMPRMIGRERGIDRTNPDYLRQWRAYYVRTRYLYMTHAASKADAQLMLMSLGFRDSALKIELLELERARR